MFLPLNVLIVLRYMASYRTQTANKDMFKPQIFQEHYKILVVTLVDVCTI